MRFKTPLNLKFCAFVLKIITCKLVVLFFVPTVKCEKLHSDCTANSMHLHLHQRFLTASAAVAVATQLH